jgi:hypothetical protein
MMKKTVVLCSVMALLLGACQDIFTPTPAPGPTIDSAATSDSLFKTAVAQTLTARPSATLPPTAMLPATATATLPPDLTTPTLGPTPTPVTDLSTATFSIETATGLPANATPTGTPTLAVGQVTAVWTLAVRKYGTLPPEVPFNEVTLINRADTEAYISLQVTMPDGRYSILEYPVEGRVRIQAPIGSYLYVAWVGGRKMVGEFRLQNNDDLSITLYRDRIVIK